MESYLEMKNRHREEFEKFPIAFAFNEKQFDEGMIKLGLDPSDTDKIYMLDDTGGFIKKTDSDALDELIQRHEDEFKSSIGRDKSGDGFIYQMFDYELGNHEYIITGRVSDALEALDITKDDFEKNPALKNGLILAQRNQVQKECERQQRNDENFEEMER